MQINSSQLIHFNHKFTIRTSVKYLICVCPLWIEVLTLTLVKLPILAPNRHDDHARRPPWDYLFVVNLLVPIFMDYILAWLSLLHFR